MGVEGGRRAGAALLVGVGGYLHADRIQTLRFAVRDAEALGELLVDPEVCGFPADSVRVLTDADASRDALAHHLSKWLPAQARGAGVALIYFAGHGTVERIGQREEGFLPPHDGDPDDLVTRGVAMGDLARWIEGIEAGAVVVCFDCCHAGRVVSGRIAQRSVAARDMRIKPGHLHGLAGRRRYLIASCDEGQVSIEAERLGHGLFTYHLLAGIRGAGDRDGDGRVGVSELFEYVAEAVERDARGLGMDQRPGARRSASAAFTSPRPRRTPRATGRRRPTRDRSPRSRARGASGAPRRP